VWAWLQEEDDNGRKKERKKDEEATTKKALYTMCYRCHEARHLANSCHNIEKLKR
jgi:cytochrome c553